MPRSSPTSSSASARRAPGHRAPRTTTEVNWTAFLGTGIVLGVLAGAYLHLSGPPVVSYGMTASLLFFVAFGALVGGLAAGAVALLVDLVLARRRS